MCHYSLVNTPPEELTLPQRNSLHSGCIGTDFVPDRNPRSGRLSIDAFIDIGR